MRGYSHTGELERERDEAAGVAMLLAKERDEARAQRDALLDAIDRHREQVTAELPGDADPAIDEPLYVLADSIRKGEK